MEKLLDISEVSARSGVSASGLRYYEKKNLIGSVARNGLRRQYEPDVLQQLALINLAKSAGFTLDEVGDVFRKSNPTALPRAALFDKANSLEKQAERLVSLANILRHVANCPAEDHFGCSRFQKLLKVAGRITSDHGKTHGKRAFTKTE